MLRLCKVIVTQLEIKQRRTIAVVAQRNEPPSLRLYKAIATRLDVEKGRTIVAIDLDTWIPR
ncbi:hypothetical protein E4U26_005718 [Claviceps purpurea]|nr:hypothetical protein E4U26_005718 [Claviceps purpurea]